MWPAEAHGIIREWFFLAKEERLGLGKWLSGPRASSEGQGLEPQKSRKCWVDMAGSLVISVQGGRERGSPVQAR